MTLFGTVIGRHKQNAHGIVIAGSGEGLALSLIQMELTCKIEQVALTLTSEIDILNE